jgi:hypothetical protein
MLMLALRLLLLALFGRAERKDRCLFLEAKLQRRAARAISGRND